MYLAEACLREGDFDKTLHHLKIELRLDPRDPIILLDLANLLMDCGQSRPAAACLKRLTTLEPDNASAWQNLAVAQFMNSRFDAGMASCHEALRCDPNATTAMYNLALAYQRQRDYPKALTWTRRAMEVDPRDSTIQRLELRIRIMQFLSRTTHALKRLIFWR